MNKRQVAAKFRLVRAGRGRMLVDPTKRALVLGALLASALALGGCAMSLADLPLIGTPADAPAAPKQAGSYLPVEDLPPGRNEAVIAPDQQAKIRAELLAARERQASSTGTTGTISTKDPATK